MLTDDKGRFEVTARASGPGDFCLLADKEGFARGERVLPKSILETGAEDVELVLTSGGSIEGQGAGPREPRGARASSSGPRGPTGIRASHAPTPRGATASTT